MDRQSKESFGAVPLCRHAAQPDIVLSEERDSYYAHTLLAESTSELMETLLGSMRAVILAPELRALASCLYFGLTNLAGDERGATTNKSTLCRCLQEPIAAPTRTQYFHERFFRHAVTPFIRSYRLHCLVLRALLFTSAVPAAVASVHHANNVVYHT